MKTRSAGRSALEIVEEALHLLRSAPPAAAMAYLVGSVPFVVALLFFLTDVTYNALAAEHLLEASLGLALLFVWKNVWQAIFMARLHAALVGDERVVTARGNLVRLIAIQAALQPISILAIPVGLLLTIPFAAIVVFFRNVALYAALGRGDAVELARKQAGLNAAQKWGVLLLLTIAGLLLFVNLLIVIALLPQLGRSFLGIEGDLARFGNRILNATTLAVAGALTWMAIDPLLDAVCVLRCFYGESVATGEDLRAALRRAVAMAAPALLLAIGLAAVSTEARAQPALAPVTQSIDPQELDQSISTVIRRRQFTWRGQRPGDERTPAPSWLTRLSDSISGWWEWFKKKLNEWFLPRRSSEREGKDAPVNRRALQWMIGLAAALVVGLLVVFLRRRQRKVIAAQAVAASPAAVDLADESLTADQLPESSWLKLADEWLAKGDCRLALRALYLAGLNNLGQRNLISIRRWKSGLDYRREVDRRTRTLPEFGPAFSRNVALFERGWYGRHAVDRQMVETFAAGLEHMRKHAG